MELNLIWTIVIAIAASVATLALMIPFKRKIKVDTLKVKPAAIDEFSQALIANSMDGIFAFDKNLRYTSWNKAMETLTGLSSLEVLGRRAPDVFPHIKVSNVLEMYEKVLRGETFHIDEQEFTYLTTKKKGYYEAN